MDLKDVQKQVDEWAQRFTVPYWQPHEILARLIEETGELGREINHRFGPKKKKSSEAESDLGEEIGDVIFTLVCLANSRGINLDEAWKRVMDKCYGRDKDRYEKKDETVRG
ncbi:MAG: nucleotide pyrophosphohydrolase [Patescibacteria group bacterium]